MKAVFINPERCIGCKQCETACAVTHSRSKNLFLAVFESPKPVARIHAEPGLSMGTSFPNRCHHCNPAPCLAVCPTAAIHRAPDRPDIVLIDATKCMACGMCAIVCPFDVITYHPSPDAAERDLVATKCNHCIGRQREGREPACVEVCKVGALVFGDINELTKAARVRYSEQVSVAVSQADAETTQTPPMLDAWRKWGEAVTRLNAATPEGA